MNDSLKIAPPRRAFLFIFLITGVVLLLNGLAVLVFAPIPRSAGAIQAPLSPSFGVGGWMPIVAGLLCFAGAGWMLNHHRKVARIADLVQAELPEDAVDPDGRSRLLSALLERADQLVRALTAFPEALVTIDLKIGEDHRLELEYVQRTISARLSPTDRSLTERIEQIWEGVAFDDEILLDLGNAERVTDFVDRLTTKVLALPPDYELSGDIRISKRSNLAPA
ncbi:MAG: hypothetical protein CME19_11975 [Gemmatimonadetes bacterium]|nr:hypothetical protein [Gemmatimonadota bacterium]